MKENISWRQFEAGRDYNRRIGLYESVSITERFYRGDQWQNVASSQLPTPVFNYIRRICDYLVTQITSDNTDFFFSDENLPYIMDKNHRERVEKAVALLNSHTSYRFDKCRLDRVIRNAVLDSAITGDGVFFTYWDPTIVTGQAYRGDFVTVNLDGVNLFVADVNSTDIQSQEYIIVSGRESVEALKREAQLFGADKANIDKIRADEDIHYGAGDCAAYENTDDASRKATYIIKFTKTEDGYVRFEKSTRDCIIKTITTPQRLYPVCMFNWIPTKNSYHGASPVKPLIQNQKYINKAYALMMKHLIDTAFSKVVFDKTRIPEWTNEVGQAIGVVGGEVSGVASVISPGEMDGQYSEIIDKVIINTKDSLGATETSLGESAPTNTSAILALQESNSRSLDIARNALHTCLEELAAIWLDFITAYYGDGRLVIGDGEQAEALDCRVLREELICAKVEVGKSSRISKSSVVTELTKLLDGGHITLLQYLERIPDGIIPQKTQLIEELSKGETENG